MNDDSENELNLGPKSAAWLRDAGIHTLDDLRAMGAVAAYFKVQEPQLRPSQNLLQSIHGALTVKLWNELSEKEIVQCGRNLGGMPLEHPPALPL